MSSDISSLPATKAFEFGWGFVVAAVPAVEGLSVVTEWTFRVTFHARDECDTFRAIDLLGFTAAKRAGLELDAVVLAEIERVHGSSLLPLVVGIRDHQLSPDCPVVGANRSLSPCDDFLDRRFWAEDGCLSPRRANAFVSLGSFEHGDDEIFGSHCIDLREVL